MRQNTLIAALAAGLIVLTGCTSAPEPEPETVAEETVETTAPLVAENTEDAEAADTPEAAFLAELRPLLDNDRTQIPNATDEQLFDAGAKACDQIANGERPENVRVIDGEEPNDLGTFQDSGRIGSVANEHLC